MKPEELKAMETIQGELANLSLETKKKYPHIKESAEEAIVTLRNGTVKNTPLQYVANQVLFPLVQTCETKDPKIVRLALAILQKVILARGLDVKGGASVMDALWLLMESSIEELKLLQTVTLMVTLGGSVLHGPPLAKALVLCLRLHFTKDLTINNTAAATVQQLASSVFERAALEIREADASSVEKGPPQSQGIEAKDLMDSVDWKLLKSPNGKPPSRLSVPAGDAFLMFQDLIFLLNGEKPLWLIGVSEMTKTFGLELIEGLLAEFPQLFHRYPEFGYLLKERVCAMTIKLFSPNVRHHHPRTSSGGGSASTSNSQASSLASVDYTVGGSASDGSPDKAHFCISLRLLRLVSVLIQNYYALLVSRRQQQDDICSYQTRFYDLDYLGQLVTQCEIFLSLVLKFLDTEKPIWQRSLSLEVLHRFLCQPTLLKTFCASYDMKPHANKILSQTMVALDACVTRAFSRPPGGLSGGAGGSGLPSLPPASAQGQPPAMLGGLPIGPGASAQPAFHIRGVYLPMTAVPSGGVPKAIYLEMLDKVDPPLVPEGYPMTVAYGCLSDLVQSILIAVWGKEGRDSNGFDARTLDPEERKLRCQLIESCWSPALSSLSLLIEASTDEAVTERLLKSVSIMAAVCGSLDVRPARDAFIAAICRACLPPHYALAPILQALNSPSVTDKAASSEGKSGELCASAEGKSGELCASVEGKSEPPSPSTGDGEPRYHVVAVGPALPSASLTTGAHQGAVTLTSKNLQCMRALLTLSHCHGTSLGTGWHLVLLTLQHLAWILGLQPSKGGSLKASRPPPDSSSVITSALVTELPLISAILTKLFESSKSLDDVALHHLIDALIRLSHESMAMAMKNRTPSLFAVAKLLETGSVNLHRLEVWWRPVTSHLLEVTSQPHSELRMWGAEAITSLVKSALAYPHDPPLRDNLKLQSLILAPLQELSSHSASEVRLRQLEALMQILHANGEALAHGWPTLLSVIGAVRGSHGEQAVRSAFQCLQLVVTDFLPVMSWTCLPLCLETAAGFGRQTQELNISLTAVGLMWNISDYFYQNASRLRTSLSSDKKVFPEFPGYPQLSPFDKLWLCVFSQLGSLCVDSRPAVRKSAGQTLFSTISAHGSLLEDRTWEVVFWQVLFPLLDKVTSSSSSAMTDGASSSPTANSNSGGATGGNILIHHSRNTAEKQWAETRVLTMQGISKVFLAKRPLLSNLNQLDKAWTVLMKSIEESALSPNSEISLAALKTFADLVTPSAKSQSSNPSSLYSLAWTTWLNIGRELLATPTQQSPPSKAPPRPVESEARSSRRGLIPSQAYLTSFISLFDPIFENIKDSFTTSDVSSFASIVRPLAPLPPVSEYSSQLGSSLSFVIPSPTDAVLTPPQQAILNATELLIKESSRSRGDCGPWLPSLHLLLLEFAALGCSGADKARGADKASIETTSAANGEVKAAGDTNAEEARKGKKGKKKSTDCTPVYFVPFAEKSLVMELEFYKQTASEQSVLKDQILFKLLKVLHGPLSKKYNCPSSSLWRLSVTVLLAACDVGLPLSENYPEDFKAAWLQLAITLEAFLFNESVPPATYSMEARREDEELDCRVVEFLRDKLLPQSEFTPKEFLLRAMVLLNKGSIHAVSSPSEEPGGKAIRVLCFEFGWKQFSLLNDVPPVPCGSPVPVTSPVGPGGEQSLTSKLAVTSLIQRFITVIIRFNENRKLSGKLPLQRTSSESGMNVDSETADQASRSSLHRHQSAEVSFVLKSIATLISSLHTAPEDQVDSSTWELLVDLYPHVVDCVSCEDFPVREALQPALMAFKALLHPTPISLDEVEERHHKNGL
ncbi:unnamed protein product [Cyprideis torosa]|uniref:Protein MON2 homolog n=1 Tax=Cyprideis torosa TaxID=163714 RepID=A0A7R8ZGH8_9CRUS|nr:unnamed protein product [Cyprideis torosa]CAG0881679.1 unnamed protein product [Cyprideis torosa]